MKTLVTRLKHDYPQLSFEVGATDCWSPLENKIFFARSGGHSAKAAILHELAHALLEHTTYKSDLELLQKELEAWEKAVLLGQKYEVTISDHHVQDCLDTYREWLYKRSLCPACTNSGLQKDQSTYVCVNCGHIWKVTASRLSRPYRRSKVSAGTK